jgi:hypothetical protein
MATAFPYFMRLSPSSQKTNPFHRFVYRNSLAVLLAGLLAVLMILLAHAARAEDSPRCEAIFQPRLISGAELLKPPAHEEKTRVIVDTFRRGSTTFNTAKKFANSLLSMGEEGRTEWLLALGATYRKIPKKDPNPLAPWHIGGRRLVDYALTLLERYDLKFAEAANKRSTQEAYAEFLERQAQLFGSEASQASIEAIVNFLKRDLMELQEKLGGTEMKVLLAGSLINGKVSLATSDLDITLEDLRLRSELPRWQVKIQETFGPKIVLEAHGVPASFYGKINPVVIEVSAKGVNFLVFPPARIAQQASDLMSEAPAVYSLGTH